MLKFTMDFFFKSAQFCQKLLILRDYTQYAKKLTKEKYAKVKYANKKKKSSMPPMTLGTRK